MLLLKILFHAHVHAYMQFIKLVYDSTVTFDSLSAIEKQPQTFREKKESLDEKHKPNSPSALSKDTLRCSGHFTICASHV